MTRAVKAAATRAHRVLDRLAAGERCEDEAIRRLDALDRAYNRALAYVEGEADELWSFCVMARRRLAVAREDGYQARKAGRAVELAALRGAELADQGTRYVPGVGYVRGGKVVG
jgi:hypothetical protein